MAPLASRSQFDEMVEWRTRRWSSGAALSAKGKGKGVTTSDGEGGRSGALPPLRRRGGEGGMGEVTHSQ